MFCGNCGAQYNDGDPFCPMCGTPTGQAASPNNAAIPAGAMEEKKSNKALPVIIGLAVVAVIIIALILVLLSGVFSGGYKKAVKTYYNALAKGDVATMENTFLPSDVYEEYIDDIYDMDLDEYNEYQQDIYDALWDGLADEGKVKYSYEIKEAENVDKLDELKKDAKEEDVKDLDDFIDMMDDAFDDYGLEADNIKSAYIVKVKWTLEIDGKKEASGTDIEFAFKYDGKWYLTNGCTYEDITSDLDSDDYEDVIDDVEDAYWDFLGEIW